MGRQNCRTKFQSAFSASLRLVTGHEYLKRHLNRTGVKDFPMCPLCSNAEEMDPDHTQRCQIVTDDMDDPKNRDKWCNVSKLYWTARKKMEDISLGGVG